MEDWESYDGLAAFLAKGYLELLSLVEPLLLDLPSTSPYACDHRPFLPLRHDYVSSVYELRFDLGLNEVTKLSLGIAQQASRSGFQNVAAGLNIHGPCPGLDIEGLFLRIDMVWLMRCPLSPPSPSELESLLSAADRPGPDPKTLLLITSWKDQEAEKNIHREYRRLQNSEDVEDPLAENILSKATSFAKHQVALEEITEDNVEFLDSEEKYKTWMSRMLEEENARKRERLARDDIRHAEWEKSGRRIATSQKHE